MSSDNDNKASTSIAAAKNMSIADLVQYRYEMSLAQMASEVYGLKAGMSDLDLTRTLRLGNSFPNPAHVEDDAARIGNQRFTGSQITDFKDTFTVVAVSSETSAAGDFAVLLQRRDGTGFVYAFRSTQPASQQYNEQKIGAYEQDSANNLQMSTYGIGLSQLDGFDRFVQNTASLLNGQPAACAGGSLSGQQCLAITELHPDIFQVDSRPNIIVNPTGMASFNEGYTVADALAIYRQVLADPDSAANLSNAPNRDTSEGVEFVQAWERAARFKNSPEGQTQDSNSVWTADASGKPIPQVAQSQPDVEFAAMAAQRQTGASFSLNLLFPERSASLNHTLVLESQNPQGYNFSVVAGMGTQPTLRTDLPIPAVPNIVGNPFDAAKSQLVDGHVTQSDIGPSHGFALPLDGSQARAYAQRLMPSLTDEQWGQMVQGATDFHNSFWVSTASPEGSEAQLWTAIFQQIGDQSQIPFNCDKCPTQPGTADAVFDYTVRNARSNGISDFMDAWKAQGQPTFSPILLTDAFFKPTQEGGVDSTTAAFFDVRNKLESASPEERGPLLAAIKTGSPIALIPTASARDTKAVPPDDTPSAIGEDTDTLIQSYAQTLRGRIENWNKGDSAAQDKVVNLSTDRTNASQPTPNRGEALPDSYAPAPGDNRGGPDPTAHSASSVALPEASDPRPAELPSPDAVMAPIEATRDPNTQSIADLDGSHDGVVGSIEPNVVLSGSSPADSSTTNQAPSTQPTNADRLTAGAIMSAANLVLAIEHGDAFAAAVSGVNLANNLSKLNDASSAGLDGAASALGTVASALNLYNALESGDAGGIIVSSVALEAALGGKLASAAIADVFGVAVNDVLPVLGVINSLAHGDALGAAIATVTVFNPLVGAALAVANMFFSGLFGGDEDIPTLYGDAEVKWAPTGQLAISTTRDDAGGGATAAGWMNSLLGGLTNELTNRTDADGKPLYGLNPNLLPRIGYAYDPDTGEGYLRLSWTEADGTEQYRQYDTKGSRHDAQTQSGVNDLARDFLEHAAAAIVPAWEAQTLFQQHGSAAPSSTAAFTGEVSADGAHIIRTVLTFGSSSIVATALDLDQDGYVERSSWTTAALLTVDLDGNGKVSADELVDGRATAGSRNSLAALDANGDGLLDNRDPGFAALSLWIDANGNGLADANEVSAAAASITTITFTQDSIQVTRSDGSASTLTRTELTGDTQGISHAQTQDGLYEVQEGGGTTLYALNQHTFDGDAAHQHGGEANPDAHGDILIDAGDTRIQSLGNATAASRAEQTHIQGDALLQSTGTGSIIAGQAVGSQAGGAAPVSSVSDAPPSAPAAPPNAAIRINARDPRVQSAPPAPAKSSNPGTLPPGLAFVPKATTNPGRAIELVTAEMIASATSGLFSTSAPLAGIAIAALPLASPPVASATEAHPDSMASPPSKPGSLTNAILLDVLAGRRHEGNSSPAPDALPIPWSNGVATSNAPLDSGIASPRVATGEGILPTQVLTDWHSAEAAITSSTAPTTASQLLGLADWVPAPPAPPAASATVTGSTILEGGARASDMPPPTQSRPLGAALFINHAPDVQGEQARSPEDTVLIISVADLLANDIDLDGATVGQTLKLTAVSHAKHGSVSLLNGQILFAPEADYFGPAGFDYTVSDGAGGESVARFSLDVQPVNDTPRAQGEAAEGTEDTRLLIDPASLLANDDDIDNAPGDLRIATLGDAHHGKITWTVGSNGQPWLAFTPDANFHGDADFTYTVSDGTGGEATATAVLSIASLNDLPLTRGETASGSEDMGITFTAAQLLANEVDADGDPLQVVRVGNSQHGTVSMNERGDASFRPDANYHGTAGFDYWVSDGQGGEAQAHVAIDLVSVNDAPIAENDVLGSRGEDAAILIRSADLLRNDRDIDSTTLTITAVSDASHGSVEQSPDGTIRFIPDADYNGPAGFRYTVSDGDGGHTTAIAVLTITAVDDAPFAHGETASGDEDHELLFPAAALLANDTDADTPYGDHLTITAVELATPTAGYVRIAEDGSVRFTPHPDFAGNAIVIYEISDSTGLTSTATLALTVLPVNDNPVALDEIVAGTEDTVLQFDPALLLANDRDVDNTPAELSISALGAAQHGTVRWQETADGQTILFTPDADYSGEAGFAYTVADGAGGEAQGYVTVNVANVNDAPVANDDSASGLEDTPLNWTSTALTDNDTDVDHDTLSVTGVGNARGGTVALIGNQVVFTPDTDYSGPGGFDYTASDGHGGLSSAHVALDIAAVNDAPTIAGETIQGLEDTALDIDPAALLANDSDVDSPHDSLQVIAVAEARHGSVTRLPDGTVRFVPDGNFAGDASFDYTVADGAGAATRGTANIHIANVNDAPVATGETITSAEDTSLILKDALLTNDTDVDTSHTALSISAVANTDHCTVVVNSDGSVTFRPDGNYSGPAAFDYTVSDGAGGYATARANFVITPVNDAPLVTNESATTDEDSIIHFSVAALLANDTDIETPNSLNIVSVEAAHGGWVSKAGDDITFSPYHNFNGTASFSYKVADPDGGVSQGRVDITYTPNNDAPVVNNEIFYSRQNVTTTLSMAALLQNDDDDSGRLNLQVNSAYNPYGGTLTYTNQQGVVFQPDSGFSGIASFYYTVSDSEGASSVGYAQIDFSKPNSNPIATDDSFSGEEDVVFNISTTQLLTNDRDADDPGNLTITGVGGATHGTVRLDSASNTVIFTPDANYNGAAQFNYTVADPYGGTAQATAFLDIRAVNDAPVIDRIDWHAVDARERDRAITDNENIVIGTVAGEHIDDPYRASGRIIAHDPDGNGSALSYSIITAPTHGKAWANQYTSADYAPRQDDQGKYYGNPVDNLFFDDGGTTPIQRAWVFETGSWQYYSMLGDPYSGSDPFTLRVTDAQGAYTEVSIGTSHLGSSINTGGGGGCPVVLDLNNNGIELLAPEDSSMFADLNGDGWKEKMGWVSPDDGVLAYDADNDGLIDVLDEVSFVKYKTGALTDLEGLAGLDSSGDGVISSADDAWSKLGVVTGAARQDSTGKVSDWSSLDSNEIAAISLERQGTPYLDHGNVVFGTSTLTFADGRTGQAGDVMFAGAGIPLPDEALAIVNPAIVVLANGEESDQAAPRETCATSTASDATPPEEDIGTGKSASKEDYLSPETSEEIARIRQQALLFNQVSASAEPDSTVLAFVPPQSDTNAASTTAADALAAPTNAELAHA